MFGIHNFSLFLVSCILLNLTPGQDTIYILGRSIARPFVIINRGFTDE